MQVGSRPSKSSDGMPSPISTDDATGVTSFRLLARDFCEETTFHGFGNFVRERLLAGRVFWLVIIMAAVAGNAWHLSMVISTYLQYNTQEIVSVSHEAAPFPDVTICSLQPMSSSTWLAEQGEEYMKAFRNKITHAEHSTVEHGIDWEEIDDRALSPVSFLENAGKDRAVFVGHQFHDFIVHCAYAGVECNEEDFTHHVDATFYNCFTFSRNLSVANETGSIGSGPSNALSVVLYLEARGPESLHDAEVPQAIYNGHSPVENAIGARVVVQQKGSLPQPLNAGFDIMPGDSTSIAVSATFLKRLQKPYGECTHNATLRGMSEYAYTSFGCLQICKQKYIVHECHCVSALLPIPKFLEGKPYCGAYNDAEPDSYFTRIECELARWHQFDSTSNTRTDCQCFTPCERYTYEEMISQSIWPGDSYVEDFYNDVVEIAGSKSHEQLGNMTHTNTTHFAELIRSNFVRINVYFKDLDVDVRVQEASFYMSQMWSNVGGTIGLWAGLSVITLAECLAFCVKVILPSCRPQQNNRRASKCDCHHCHH